MIIVGIGGGTCSGKSTLLHGLAKRLGHRASVMSFDDYFIGSDLYNLDEIADFEEPGLCNFESFVKDLEEIKQGKEITIRANSRESVAAGIKERIVQSKPIVIVEGWLIYHDPLARKLFDLKLFVEIPEDEIVRRRFGRSKGSKHWDDHDYINNKILPGYKRYVVPQRRYADLILDGMQAQADLVEESLSIIAELNAAK